MSQTISGPVPSFKLSDGKSIPTIGWGNGTGGDAKAKAVQIGKQAISAGLRHLDTAQGYNNEVETGETVKQCGLSRGDLWVTSKLSQENGVSQRHQSSAARATEETVSINKFY
jgi:diketogulonate reductase-like aldo/keto reductase